MKATRKQLQQARRELEKIGNRDGAETPAFLRANRKVIRIEKSLPWWKR